MTPEELSLRERLSLVATDFNEWGHIRSPEQVIQAILPIIEAELQKRDEEKARLVETAVRLLKAWRATQWSPFGGGPLTGLNDDTADFCREYGTKP